MKNTWLIIAFCATVLGASLLYYSSGSGTLKKELKDFAVEDTASVSKVFISDAKGNKVLLERTSPGSWLVNNTHMARQDAINNLLLTIHRMEVKYPVPESEMETVVRKLASEATKVEIYSGKSSKPLKVIYVGHPTQNHFGTYMLLEKNGKKSSEPFVMHIPGFSGFLSTRFFAESALWRDRSLFVLPVDKIKKLQVQLVEEPTHSFTIEQSEKNRFALFDYAGKPVPYFDTAAVYDYLTRYADIYFEQIDYEISQERKDSILKSRPFHIFTLTDKDGKVTVAKTFHIENFRQLMKEDGTPYDWDIDRMRAEVIYPDASREFTFVQFATFDRIITKIGRFTPSGLVEK